MMSPGSLPSFLFTEMRKGEGDEGIAAALLHEKSQNLISAVRNFEKNFIKNVLSAAPSKSDAIKTLGISRRAFYLKLKKFKILESANKEGSMPDR